MDHLYALHSLDQMIVPPQEPLASRNETGVDSLRIQKSIDTRLNSIAVIGVCIKISQHNELSGFI